MYNLGLHPNTAPDKRTHTLWTIPPRSKGAQDSLCPSIPPAPKSLMALNPTPLNPQSLKSSSLKP